MAVFASNSKDESLGRDYKAHKVKIFPLCLFAEK